MQICLLLQVKLGTVPKGGGGGGGAVVELDEFHAF